MKNLRVSIVKREETNNMNKNYSKVATILVVMCLVVFGGIFLTRNVGKSEKVVNTEAVTDKLEKYYLKVAPSNGTPKKSSVEYNGSEVEASELPDINTCAVNAKATTSTYVEIWSSPEKAGDGDDGWLCEMANKFNKQGNEVDGIKVSVQIRNVNSGQAVEYITTGAAIPDGLSTSSIFWVNMLDAKGIEVQVISDRLVGNTVGMVFKNDKYKTFIDKYGSMDVKSVVDAVVAGEYVVGYTNPNASTGGMNWLIATLQRYDSNNPLSDEAVEGFKSFQQNVPFIALTTMQMRKAAESGSLDGFVMEYQSYQKDPNLKKNYTFTPYGYRHDNPLVSVGHMSDTKLEILKMFAEFCESEESQKIATSYGFNAMDNYNYELPMVDGATLIKAQKLYKDNKDNGNSVVAVFLVDVSGSMRGEAISEVKRGLVNSMKYINSENYIGLVSFSHEVTIEVPIGQFDMTQQSLFKGGVEGLVADGNTAMYDGLIVASKMISDMLKEDPTLKPMIFLLSDGENRQGYSFRDVSGIIETLGYPVYTIGYNDNDPSLSSLSSLNEAENINANTSDIVYQLKTLFEANM